MKIIVGVSGVSGGEMSMTLLKALHEADNCEAYLVVSDGAKLTWELE